MTRSRRRQGGWISGDWGSLISTRLLLSGIAIGVAIVIALVGLAWFAWWLLTHLQWVS